MHLPPPVPEAVETAPAPVTKRPRGRPKKIVGNMPSPQASAQQPSPSPLVSSSSQHSLADTVLVENEPCELSDVSHRDYQSAVAKHLAMNVTCRKLYSDSDFKVVPRASSRTEWFVSILESVYIGMYKPDLCVQKKVVPLKLFPHCRSRS